MYMFVMKHFALSIVTIHSYLNVAYELHDLGSECIMLSFIIKVLVNRLSWRTMLVLIIFQGFDYLYTLKYFEVPYLW